MSHNTSHPLLSSSFYHQLCLDTPGDTKSSNYRIISYTLHHIFYYKYNNFRRQHKVRLLNFSINFIDNKLYAHQSS